MAFVSKDCIDEWFSPRSWVYKGFAYLFQNPLWDKRIPKGFSLCPYFWLAIFSILLFKPIIVPSFVLIGTIGKKNIKIGGAPFALLDRLIRHKILKDEQDRRVGVGLSLCIAISLIITMISVLGYLLFQKVILTLPFLYQMLIAWGVFNGIVVIVTSTYISNNKYNKERCKVELYALVVFILSSIAYYYRFPEDVGTSLGMVKAFFGGMLSSFGHWLLYILSWIPVLLKYGAYFLWVAVKYTGIAFGWTVICLVPLAIIGYLFMKFGSLIDAAFVENRNKIRKVTESDWQYLIYDFWIRNKHHSDFLRYYTLPYDTDSDSLTEFNITKFCVHDFFRHIIFKELTIPKLLLDMPYHDFVDIEKRSRQKDAHYLSSLTSPYNEPLYNALQTIWREIDEFAKYRDAASGNKVSNEIFEKHFRADYQKSIQSYRDFKNKKTEVKKAVSKKRNEMCRAISVPLEKFFVGLIWNKAIKIPARLIWKILRNVGIFFAYMWLVLKNVKQGACPYRMFATDTDPSIKAGNTGEKE